MCEWSPWNNPVCRCWGWSRCGPGPGRRSCSLETRRPQPPGRPWAWRAADLSSLSNCLFSPLQERASPRYSRSSPGFDLEQYQVGPLSQLTFSHHADGQALLEAAELAAVAPPLVHGTVLVGEANVLGILLDCSLKDRRRYRNRELTEEPRESFDFKCHR